ncbi:unnamed protein product [Cylicocyclus nassatus]|uniref:Uncharacterized protein n=1 Tax=Cylicocyclus nassatus TaxID=53992 RepID=A0AA36HBR4_CYLNA|nr:unnamed protein product [Cylicocyclus nassatus]
MPNFDETSEYKVYPLHNSSNMRTTYMMCNRAFKSEGDGKSQEIVSYCTAYKKVVENENQIRLEHSSTHIHEEQASVLKLSTRLPYGNVLAQLQDYCREILGATREIASNRYRIRQTRVDLHNESDGIRYYSAAEEPSEDGSVIVLTLEL